MSTTGSSPRLQRRSKARKETTDVAGVLVPVVVHGTVRRSQLTSLTSSNLVDQAIKDPKALEKQVKDQIEAVGGSSKDVKDALKNIGKDDAKKLLDNVTKGDEDASDSPAGNLLRGLLKN